MKKANIHDMITQDLGYCCEHWFFSHYKQTALVAARLGMTTRAVRYHKASAREAQCEKKDCCMLKKGKV